VPSCIATVLSGHNAGQTSVENTGKPQDNNKVLRCISELNYKGRKPAKLSITGQAYYISSSKYPFNIEQL